MKKVRLAKNVPVKYKNKHVGYVLKWYHEWDEIEGKPKKVVPISPSSRYFGKEEKIKSVENSLYGVSPLIPAVTYHEIYKAVMNSVYGGALIKSSKRRKKYVK